MKMRYYSIATVIKGGMQKRAQELFASGCRSFVCSVLLCCCWFRGSRPCLFALFVCAERVVLSRHKKRLWCPFPPYSGAGRTFLRPLTDRMQIHASHPSSTAPNKCDFFLPQIPVGRIAPNKSRSSAEENRKSTSPIIKHNDNKQRPSSTRRALALQYMNLLPLHKKNPL